MLPGTGGRGDQDFSRAGMAAMQQSIEVLAANLTAETEERRAPTGPASGAALILSIIVVLAIVVVEVVQALPGVH
jgi:hypothetical protein